MKTQSHQNFTEPVQMNSPIHLNKLVSRLISGLLPEAIEKRSIIVNDVDASVFINADENELSYVIAGLVGNAVYSTSNCCIRVQTVVSDGKVHLKVMNDGVFIYSSRMHSLGHMVDAARKLGGNISLYSEENRGITIVLSFYSKHAA